MNRATTKVRGRDRDDHARGRLAGARRAGGRADRHARATPNAAHAVQGCSGQADRAHRRRAARGDAREPRGQAAGTNKDPFGLNGPQIAALQTASAGITALDGQIAGTCYPTLAALRADAKKLFVDYRVYWLRGPQTRAIGAADASPRRARGWAGRRRRLRPLVGSNANAQTDLAAMNQALSAADAKLGTPPNAGPTIAPAAGLQPAADMTNDTAALQAAHADLLAARAALAEARADGLKVVGDLQG